MNLENLPLWTAIHVHAKTETGNVQRMSVMEPVPFMEKGIIALLMERNFPLMGIVATPSLRIIVETIQTAPSGSRLRASPVEQVKASAPLQSSSI